MRRLFGALSILLLFTTSAMAQATGEVETVGFQNEIRPDTWLPMVVRLKPTTAEAGTFQIQVIQHDLDGDRAIYTRQITLNGSDQSATQRFWMYFLPSPIEKGLPDQANNGTLQQLQHDLQVFLCTASGKQIVQLPITAPVINVDPYRVGDFSQNPRGAKLLLTVTDGGAQPSFHDYQDALGVNEDVEVVSVKPADLPEDPLGYEPVDAIVWFDSDPADLDRGGQHKLAALQDYVKNGGRLVMCQPGADWQKYLGFGELLPVEIQGIATMPKLQPLRSFTHSDWPDISPPDRDMWAALPGPFLTARATAKPDTVVDDWIDWKQDGSYSDATPYLVRKPYGLGQVTWVAQDLGSPAIVGRSTPGWPHIWDHVFAWRNRTFVLPANLPKDDPSLKNMNALLGHGSVVDLGSPLVEQLNLPGKGVWLIAVAVVFFIVYWIVAGPGGYFYLASQQKVRLSWFFFAASAMAATLLTVLVVKLVLRGPPQIQHLSFVRVAPAQPARIDSRFGLYIPRDGDQSLTLSAPAHDGVSCVSGFAEPPSLLGIGSEFPAPLDYEVPVRDLDSTEAPSITVPYRSSLKKFQARWIGTPEGGAGILGSVALDEMNARVPLKGSLTNDSGHDLDDIYFAVHIHDDLDWVLYLPHWKNHETIDIAKTFAKAAFAGSGGNLMAMAGENKPISDALASDAQLRDRKLHGWMNVWYAHFYHANSGGGLVSGESGYGFAFPMLTLFDRLPPATNDPPPPNERLWSDDRFELFRRGGRSLDASGALTAGRLVVFSAHAGPMPEPIEINGDVTPGNGTTFYQWQLPVDRGDSDKPATQPSSK